MPIRIPDALPATAALENENIFVMTEHRAMHQDIRPLRLLLLHHMPIFLNRFHKSNWLVIFLVAAVIGGAFEAFVSLFMQYAFGAVAWDYSNMPGSLFGGRTCLPFMACWGLLGVVWIKLLLPFMLRLVNFIPWNWRYMLTTVAACFMLVDAVMTLQALDCWYMRLSHDPIDTPIQQFYDHEFGDTYMADRFRSMTIVPSDAVRG